MLDIRSLETAMDVAPESIFFIKDHSSKYLSCNQALARMCGTDASKDVIGHRTQDFFGEELVSRYDALDQEILRGFTLLDRFDFLHDADDRPVWTLYSRMPVVLENQEPAILGISQILPSFRKSDRVYQRLHIATGWIANRLESDISLVDCAALCDCSTSQLQRDFRSVLAISPSRYQAKLRLQLAKDKIKKGHPLISVAMACGFSEQSGFCRFFKKQTGMTVSDFRKTASLGR